jgi:pantetheine-phosphate adenylyltransferase
MSKICGVFFFVTTTTVARCLSRFHRRAWSNKSSAIRKVALIEVNFPSGSLETETKIRNEFILNSILAKERFDRYFISVKGAPTVITTKWLSYVSELYSRTWNDVVLKKLTHTEFFVMSEKSMTSELIEKEKITTVFSEVDAHDCVPTLVNTATYTSVIDQGFRENSVIFLESESSVGESKVNSFRSVAVGGSFDHLHSGHRKLLNAAASLCTSKLTVGVTGESLLANKENVQLIQSFERRTSKVQEFLTLINPLIALNIVKIEDPFGPTISDVDIDAIVVSSETIVGGFRINEIRERKGMTKLVILVVDRQDAAVLSSTYIRHKELKK